MFMFRQQHAWFEVPRTDTTSAQQALTEIFEYKEKALLIAISNSGMVPKNVERYVEVHRSVLGASALQLKGIGLGRCLQGSSTWKSASPVNMANVLWGIFETRTPSDGSEMRSATTR